MKQLIILRHGKAEQNTMSMDDFDRALTQRGIKNATGMGEFIVRKMEVPDLILSSSAKRAHQTAVLAADAIGYPKEKIETDHRQNGFLTWSLSCPMNLIVAFL